MSSKKRLDVTMVERGLAESRQKAQAVIMAGQVYVNGQKVDKAGAPVAEDAAIEVRGKTLAYVSRGGLKLEKAMELWPIRLEGAVCADIGASTGGFTDCMLQNGAEKVYAVDVGYNQLDYRLRTHPKVVCMERTNARYLTREQIPEPLDFFSVDVSFISLNLIFPAVRPLMKEGGEGVCLIKPQFEAGKDKVGKKGVVRDASVHLEVRVPGLSVHPAGAGLRRRPEGAGGGLPRAGQGGQGMRIILSSNPYRDKGLRTALEADRILRKAGAETVLCLPFVPRKGDRLDLPRNLSLRQLEEELPRADLLVCFGGDGTILHAARDATLHGVPILGVNMGSVGFMAELERTELSLLVPLAQGHFVTEERMMLDVQVFRGGRPVSQDLALNDAVFSKGSMARVAEVEVWADQTMVQRIMGDGVIVATPTGSTAYSMSAGGPIVEPSSQCLIVTPVCAHQLAARALVLEPTRRVVVQLPRGNRKHLYLSVDGGKAIRLTGGERVEITRSRYRTQLVQLSGRSFYEIINQKLGGYTP